MDKRDIAPIHPGEILLEDFLKPMKIDQNLLAESISIPLSHVNKIVHGQENVTADIALRLGRFFDMEAQFWLNLQTRYDLEVAKEILSDRLEKEVKVCSSF